MNHNFLINLRKKTAHEGFSLVEIALTLGIVAYSLLALLSLFSIGLDSNRQSTVETSLARIAQHVSDHYTAANMSDGVVTYQQGYTYEGTAVPEGGQDDDDSKLYFTATVRGVPAEGAIPDGPANMHLITVEIGSIAAHKSVIQTSAILP